MEMRRQDRCRRNAQRGNNRQRQDEYPDGPWHRLGGKHHCFGFAVSSGFPMSGGVVTSASSNVIVVSAEYFL